MTPAIGRIWDLKSMILESYIKAVVTLNNETLTRLIMTPAIGRLWD